MQKACNGICVSEKGMRRVLTSSWAFLSAPDLNNKWANSVLLVAAASCNGVFPFYSLSYLTYFLTLTYFPITNYITKIVKYKA